MQWRHGCRAIRRSVCNAGASNVGRSLCVQVSREWSYPLPIYWYHSKGNWLRYNFAAESFYIMKLCSRLFVLYCRNCPKDDKFRYFIPILRKLEPWLMARWKARVEFLLSVIELLFLSLTVEPLQGKMCQNSLPSWGGRSLGAKILGGRGHPPANILIPLERQLIALQLCRGHFLVVTQSIAFWVVSIYWQGVAPFPWYLNARDRPVLEAPALHTLRLIARQPWRHCVISLRLAY